MKKSILKFSALLLVFSFANSALNDLYAQKLVFIFAHARFDAAPLDESTKKRYSNGFGGEAGIGLGHKNTFFTGTIGYTSFSAKDGYTALSYVPVKAGVRYYLPLPVKILFINGDLGVGIIKSKALENSETRFATDLGAGIKLGSFEILTSVDAFTEKSPDGWSSWWNIKAGWRFGL